MCGSGILLLAALSVGAPWQQGVDPFTRGTYDDHTVSQYGMSGPGVTLMVRDKEAWPEVNLAGLWTYIYVFYGKDRDDWGKRLASFGAVTANPRATPRQTAVAATWNARTHTYCCADQGPQAMAVRVTNLFPGFTVTTDGRDVTLFHGMPKQAPSYLAYAEPSGVRTRRIDLPGPSAAARGIEIDVGKLSEPWILAWFADSQGLKDVRYGGTPNGVQGADVPWLIVLEHRAAVVSVGEQGLSLRFPSRCGTLVAMPLFGRILQAPDETRRWMDGVPPDVLKRARFWTSASRSLPISCREEFQYEPSGAVLVKNTFSYQDITDDWKTRATRLAPVPPAVGICQLYCQTYQFPLEFLDRIQDAGYLSQWGPYFYVRDADTVTYRVAGVGKYLAETLAPAPGASPRSEAIVRQIQSHVESMAARPSSLRHAVWSSNENGPVFLGTRAEQVWALARTVPWLPKPIQEKVKEHLRKMCVEDILDAKHWEPIGTAFGARALAYRFKPAKMECWMDYQYSRIPYALWAYAFYTGDWALVRDNWPLLQSVLASYAVRHDYASCTTGTAHVPLRLNAGMNGLIGLARMARRLEDADGEGRAAYLLAKSMLAWFAQWKAPNYLQRCDPREEQWHALHCYATAYGDKLPKPQSATGNYLNTRTQSWYPQNGFTWCTDPTLFSAPWSEIFLEASPEVLRFYADYFRADVADQFDYVTWLWPLTFSNAFSYQTGLGQWGMASPYFRVAAFVKGENAQQLQAWLPDAQFPDDPFYLENLLAVLYADGGAAWKRAALFGSP